MDPIEVIVHENYDATSFKNDIALLKLPSAISTTGKFNLFG